jgi:hypothetical protein
VLVYHDPKWVPGPIVINAQGDTKPGFWCIHILENGNGPCGGNWFTEETDQHCCKVEDEYVGS